ncbi:hypothetical protein D3C71_1256920 [compost metagenome]
MFVVPLNNASVETTSNSLTVLVVPTETVGAAVSASTSSASATATALTTLPAASLMYRGAGRETVKTPV